MDIQGIYFLTLNVSIVILHQKTLPYLDTSSISHILWSVCVCNSSSVTSKWTTISKYLLIIINYYTITRNDFPNDKLLAVWQRRLWDKILLRNCHIRCYSYCSVHKVLFPKQILTQWSLPYSQHRSTPRATALLSNRERDQRTYSDKEKKKGQWKLALQPSNTSQHKAVYNGVNMWCVCVCVQFGGKVT